MSAEQGSQFTGYVLRGGPFDGTAVYGRLPNFVRAQYEDDGTADVYKPTGEPDGSNSSLQRYQLEPIGSQPEKS